MTLLPPMTYLFVPGMRFDLFEKAASSAAERVILDLEDSVAELDKSKARSNVVEALLNKTSNKMLIRINAVDSPFFQADLEALEKLCSLAPTKFAGIVIPKFEDSEVVDLVREKCGGRFDVEIIGIIETAKAVQRSETLASSGITRLAVGAVDLSFDLDSEVDSATTDWVYSRLVIESRASNICAPLGSPPLELHAAERIEESARKLKGMGVGGQLCIHPAQIGPVQRGFRPTLSQISWARQVLDSVGSAVQVDGEMVDKPVRNRAQRILQQHQGGTENANFTS